MGVRRQKDCIFFEFSLFSEMSSCCEVWTLLRTTLRRCQLTSEAFQRQNIFRLHVQWTQTLRKKQVLAQIYKHKRERNSTKWGGGGRRHWSKTREGRESLKRKAGIEETADVAIISHNALLLSQAKMAANIKCFSQCALHD